MDNKFSLILPIFIITTLSLFGLIIAFLSDEVIFDDNDIITYISVVMFILVLLLSFKDIESLSFWLAFIILGFPSSFDNIFPGVYLESPDRQVIFPFTNHIELFLLLVLINNWRKVRNFKIMFFPYILIILFLISIIINIIYNYTGFKISLLISGMYPVRIFTLLCILITNIPINKLQFIRGLGISMLFLFFESFINTKLRGLGELTSASLGCNTYGNVIGQVTCVFIVAIYVTKILSKQYIGYILLGILIVILTGTRMALLAMLLVLGILIFPKLSKQIKVNLSILIFFIVVVITSLEFEKYDLGKFNIVETLQFVSLYNGTIDIQMSENTSSILTRLSLWGVAVKMFSDNIFTGIGWNLFNILKYEYGFQPEVIIDPHNGYFAFLCQLGLISIPYIIFYYICPWKWFKSIKSKEIRTLLIFNMGMSICEFTNAGIYKYNVFALLSFIGLISYYEYKSINQKLSKPFSENHIDCSNITTKIQNKSFTY